MSLKAQISDDESFEKIKSGFKINFFLNYKLSLIIT